MRSTPIEATAPRCAAARATADHTPCDGIHDAVHVHDYPLGGRGTTTDGCEQHAALLLASLAQGRVHPGSAGDGSALRVYKAARVLEDIVADPLRALHLFKRR